MHRKTTQEDLRMLLYFWNEKEDIERYVDFDEIRSDLQERYPHILKAFQEYKIAMKTVTAVISGEISQYEED